MPIFRISVSILLITVISRTTAVAQISLDGLDLDGDIYAWFQQAIDKQPPPFLQGMQYSITEQSKEQHQFYKSLSWAVGDLTFSGREFHDVNLLYNSYEDVLIALNFGMKTEGVPAILLDQNQVEGFTIYKTKFVHLQDSLAPPAGKGFYELYYKGENVTVLTKHSKLKDTNTSGVIYKEKKEIFLLLDEKYYVLNNKKSVLSLFPYNKDEIKRFIRNEGVKFNKQNSKGLKELLEFCDKIIQE